MKLGIVRSVQIVTILGVSALSLAGCGGGGGGSATGRASITIHWPDRARLIPVAANSIRAVITRGAEQIAALTVPRPATGGETTVTFDSLKIGSFTLTATAYPNADATGTAQATGATPVTISDGQTATVSVVMNTTIDHVEISPSGSTSVPVDETAALTVTAKDAAGNVVLILPDTVHWSTSNATFASVAATGVVSGVLPTGNTPGTVQISVTESESGKSASVPVRVTSTAVVNIDPPSQAISIGDAQTFTASVDNSPSHAVTWTIQEGATGGAITNGGVYTAPSHSGSYHVVATSQFDNSKSTSATVTVQSGGASIIIK